jgi:SAM-dependent methyltransferase
MAPVSGVSRRVQTHKGDGVVPTVEQNVAVWGQQDPWSRGGDDWSDTFGGTDLLWDLVVLPRICHLLGGRTVEIAPGYGRMTAKLLPLVEHLTAADLNQNCVDACEERFVDAAHLEVYKNDGRTLAMIPDASVDFVFSFDALVHTDADVMESYLGEVARVLAPGGAAFIHHSNVGSYLDPVRRLLGRRAAERLNARTNCNWRGADVSATRLRAHAHRVGLKLNVAEQVTWHSRLLNDCFSLFSRSGAETTIKDWRFFRGSAATADVIKAYRGG